MLWTTIGFAFFAMWGMLTAFSGEHRRQTDEQAEKDRIVAEQAAAAKKLPSH
jgi:hypothetical protein